MGPRRGHRRGARRTGHHREPRAHPRAPLGDAMIEKKVKASGLAALAAGLIDWALAEYVFKGHHVDAAVTAEVYAAIPAVIATAAGYLAPHTSRPVVPTPAPPSNVTVQPPPAAHP